MTQPTHLATGKEGEAAAAQYLSQNGYQILGQNVRLGALEIDFICQDQNEIIVIEVKARIGNALPELAVSSAKQKRLFRAAERYTIEHQLCHLPTRFDIIAIQFNKNKEIIDLQHFKDAFRAFIDPIKGTQSW